MPWRWRAGAAAGTEPVPLAQEEPGAAAVDGHRALHVELVRPRQDAGDHARRQRHQRLPDLDALMAPHLRGQHCVSLRPTRHKAGAKSGGCTRAPQECALDHRRAGSACITCRACLQMSSGQGVNISRLHRDIHTRCRGAQTARRASHDRGPAGACLLWLPQVVDCAALYRRRINKNQ